MGFPWKKLKLVGVAVGSMFVPGLAAAVESVEENLSDLKGPDKKAAALAMAQTIIETAEGAAGKDLVNDPAVLGAAGAYVDAVVSVKNAEAALRSAIAASKANMKGTGAPS